MEGRVYYCGWKTREHGYEIWVLSNKRVKGRGFSFRAAEESLLDAVMRVYGDGEPAFEYIPAHPETNASADAPFPYVIISGNENYRGFVGDGRGSLFTGPSCQECGIPSGERTPDPLKVEKVYSGTDGISIFWDNHLKNTTCSGVSRQAFSEKFLSLLTDQERSQFEWREVKVNRRSSLRFYELISSTTVRFVGKAGIQFWSWSCPKCSFRPGLNSPSYLNLPHFVSESELGTGRTAFAAAERESPYLCLTHARWNKLLRNDGIKGIVSSPVAVLPEGQVSLPETYPLPLYEELSKIKDRLWRQYRDQLLRSPEVLRMRSDAKVSDSEVWDYIHAQVDEKLAFPTLYRQLDAHRSA